MNDEDEAYEIGKRDGYESAVQDFDLATGGDGEFKGSTIPGETVDVPAMKARTIARFERLRSQLVRAKGEITKLAAECHRAKWQFDLSEDFTPTRQAGKALAAKAFQELHRIGDIAIVAKTALTDETSK